MELFSLRGKVALVTGASRGLGKAMAEAMAKAGATVVLAARDTDRVAPVAQEIVGAGGNGTDMAEPVTRDPQRMQVFTDCIALGRWGRPEELAGAAIFLASETGSYVNGHVLQVDGGVADVLSLPIAVSS